jgi:hypothetical protein
VLVSRIVSTLASGHAGRTGVAGRCLGDVVAKLGDSVLPQVIPVLRNALYDGDENTRRGVCVGLTEVINCSTKDQISRFVEIIAKVLQDALSDESASVRGMAAISFQSLYTIIGSRALDEVVPSLLVALENAHDETSRKRALNGLTGVLSTRSRELLPYIIPRLIQQPITIDHARALGGIAEVTGSSIYYHFSSIVPALIYDLSEPNKSIDPVRDQALRDCISSICKFVGKDGVNILVSEMANKCGSDKPQIRSESCLMLQSFIISSKY